VSESLQAHLHALKNSSCKGFWFVMLTVYRSSLSLKFIAQVYCSSLSLKFIAQVYRSSLSLNSGSEKENEWRVAYSMIE